LVATILALYPQSLHLSDLRVFFSSRRRHTRSKRDWSSDVCSSDLWSEVGLDKCPILNGLLKQSFRPLLHGLFGPAINGLYVSVESIRRGIKPVRHRLLFLEGRV